MSRWPEAAPGCRSTAGSRQGAVLHVPLLNLARQHAVLRPRLLDAVGRVIDSGRFILGPRVEELEARLAGLTRTTEAVSCGSGTDALQLALRVLEIGPGDCVITTAYSFFATAEAVSLAGARPVFCDIEPETFNLDPEALRRFCERECRVDQGRLVHRATGLTARAIVPVHLFGQCADMAGVMTIAGQYDLPVIEDACQSLGAEQELNREWRPAGSIGRLGCFSFYPTKNLSALGEAGAVVTSDRALAGRLRELRVHGAREPHRHVAVGLNSRLDEVQAAILLVKLEELAGWNRQRAAHAEYYDLSLAGLVRTPIVRAGNRSVHNQYVVRLKERDRVQRFLAGRGVQTAVYYPRSLPEQPCYRAFGGAPGDYPNAEQASRENLALPIDPFMNHEEREYVVGRVREAVSS